MSSSSSRCSATNIFLISLVKVSVVGMPNGADAPAPKKIILTFLSDSNISHWQFLIFAGCSKMVVFYGFLLFNQTLSGHAQHRKRRSCGRRRHCCSRMYTLRKVSMSSENQRRTEKREILASVAPLKFYPTQPYCFAIADMSLMSIW